MEVQCIHCNRLYISQTKFFLYDVDMQAETCMGVTKLAFQHSIGDDMQGDYLLSHSMQRNDVALPLPYMAIQ
jgi:hypothetical protein